MSLPAYLFSTGFSQKKLLETFVEKKIPTICERSAKVWKVFQNIKSFLMEYNEIKIHKKQPILEL